MHLDPALVMDGLTEQERSAIESLLYTLGLEEDEWVDIPGLRSLLEVVSGLRLSAHYADVANASDRMRLSAEDLGCDDGERSHPGDVLLSRLYDWIGPGVAKLVKSQSARAEELVASRHDS